MNEPKTLKVRRSIKEETEIHLPAYYKILMDGNIYGIYKIVSRVRVEYIFVMFKPPGRKNPFVEYFTSNSHLMVESLIGEHPCTADDWMIAVKMLHTYMNETVFFVLNGDLEKQIPLYDS